MLELGLQPWLAGSKASLAMRLSHFTRIPALLLTFLTSGAGRNVGRLSTDSNLTSQALENAAQPLIFEKDPERKRRGAGCSAGSPSVPLVATDQGGLSRLVCSDAMSSRRL